MSKFSIENIIIEKSDKDIQTGVTRKFSDGINLICGSNEAGKSSLMSFIRQGFFKVKGIDTGKIFFKTVDETGEKHYRTDIRDNRTADLRCKVFDENNLPVSYNFIENTINKKYFEQGFTINLDDLMSIQNKDTQLLVNTIKDPSGEKLSSLLEKIRLEAKKILGDNNRLTKETSKILDDITKVNIKINELSNFETLYLESVQELKEINGELDKIFKLEELSGILLQIKNLNDKLTEITEQKNIILLKFNENLYNNQEQYTKIIQNAGKIEANKNILQKNSAKTEQLNSKIYIETNRLRSEFSLDPKKEDIENFTVDYSVLRRLKELCEKKNQLEKELIASKQNKENLEENLLKLKHEILPLKEETVEEAELNKLKDLYDYVNENLVQYNYLQAKINDILKLRKINSQGVFSSRNLIILFCLLFAMTVSVSILCFCNNITEAGIFSVITAVFSLIGIIAMKIASYSDSEEKDRKQTIELKDKIFVQLKERLKEYYKEIDNIEASYFPAKAESLKNELQNKIQNYTRINEIIAKNIADTNYNTEKTEAAEKKINQLQEEIDKFEEGVETLIKSVNNNIEIPYSIYVSAVEAIKNLKEDMLEHSNVIKDSIELQNENIKIIDEFNTFIAENKIQLSLSDNYTENIQRLKAFNETNSELQNNINILESQLENINKQINLSEEKKSVFKDIENEHITMEELIELKREKLNRRKEVEFQKRELEEFEGLNDLKIKKSVLLEEYRKKIFTLMKDKIILLLTKTAKDGFDKVQPDLQNAQKYLEILTGGKYRKINPDLEEIQSADGSVTKKWEDLSRGTKEQVYLALRLGYASNYTKDRMTMAPNGKYNLPLIIDDAFVNFDAARTRQGIKCLIEFAKNNQILFFTCHGDIMKKHFEELANEAGLSVNVINIG